MSYFGFLSDREAPLFTLGFDDQATASDTSQLIDISTIHKSDSTALSYKDPGLSKDQSRTSLGPQANVQTTDQATLMESRNRTEEAEAAITRSRAPRLSAAMSLPPPISGDMRGADDPAKKVTDFDPIIIPANCYTICLCLDNREHAGRRADPNRDRIQAELQRLGIETISVALAIGDVAWIARNNSTEGPRSVLLDYICERKRLDDLISSIKDGR